MDLDRGRIVTKHPKVGSDRATVLFRNEGVGGASHAVSPGACARRVLLRGSSVQRWTVSLVYQMWPTPEPGVAAAVAKIARRELTSDAVLSGISCDRLPLVLEDSETLPLPRTPRVAPHVARIGQMRIWCIWHPAACSAGAQAQYLAEPADQWRRSHLECRRRGHLRSRSRSAAALRHAAPAGAVLSNRSNLGGRVDAGGPEPDRGRG